jgi:hypothetical protein
MSIHYEKVARRIVRDLQVHTGGDVSRWAAVHSIARRLVLRDQDLIDRAIIHAYERGWIEIQGVHSVKLTEKGSRLFIKPPKGRQHPGEGSRGA